MTGALSLIAWLAAAAPLVVPEDKPKELASNARDYFTIAVVDEATGRGVPLVELRTVNEIRYVTDSQGLVAYNEPGLMGQTVFFYVRSHGYEFPADGFGFKGERLEVTAGGKAELKIKRINIAQRLYRVTGGGIYRDSALLGRDVPISEPVVNGQVLGSDSVNTVEFDGQIYWTWGDTNRGAYPLGTFHVPSATSKLPERGGLDPRVGVELTYFKRDDGFVASTCEMPGEGPTWIDGVCVIRDSAGKERMFAKYVKVRKYLEVYQRGLVEWNRDKKRFEKVAEYDFAAPLYPQGHVLGAPSTYGAGYVYFGNPYPLVRVKAEPAALADPKQFEAFTPLVAGSRLEKPLIERDAQGNVVYGWKRDTPAPAPQEQAKWIKAGLLKSGEGLLALTDYETGKPVTAHAGSVTWNEYRKRWVMITCEVFGTSHLGETWFAESETPQGPWVYARKVVTHDKYSFYNPKQHPMLDHEGGRSIFFEGTYTTSFSGNDNPTPRYEYNQVMYELDVADPRLSLPVAVYQETSDSGQSLLTKRAKGETRTVPAKKGPKQVAFFAPDRPVAGMVQVQYQPRPGAPNVAACELVIGSTVSAERMDETMQPTDLAFYALPADTPNPPKGTVPLYGWQDSAGRHYYAAEGQQAPAGYSRSEKPLCRVWRSPITMSVDWQ